MLFIVIIKGRPIIADRLDSKAITYVEEPRGKNEPQTKLEYF